MPPGWITRATVQSATAVVSVVLAGLSLILSVSSLRVAKQGEERLNSRDMREYASKVYVAEGPSSFATSTQRVNEFVYNASGSPIIGVWVQGRDDRFIRIWTIAPCEMYELPSYKPGPSPQSDFQAVTLYFKDPNGEWQREEKSLHLDRGYKKMPEGNTADHTLHNMPIAHCS